MALMKEGEYWHGDSSEDLKQEIIRYSKVNGYEAHHFAVARCGDCGGDKFELLMNETEGVAVRICCSCEHEHGIGDSDDYINEVDELYPIECVCGKNHFQIVCGVSLYLDSEDVRWFYLGCRCLDCSIVGVYGDWKNEYIGYQGLLEHV